MDNKLVLEKISKKYKNKTIVDSISIELEKGEIVGLLGPNGAGKTTSFYICVGLIKQDKGRVLLNNQDVSAFPMFVRAQKGIGYLPQDASVFKTLTVYENIAIVLEFLEKKNNIKAKTMQFLEEFKIAHLCKQKAYSLSGGERRRLEIARLLATDPSFILLDEPFAGIDPLSIRDVQQIIKKLQEKDIGILISDHNAKETLEVCNRAYIIFEGKKILEGSPQEIIQSPVAKRIYFGDSFSL